ncbi:armadillo-type protein [Schizophyllum commune]
MSSMFKGILPHKRVVSTDEFTMVTPPLGDVNGKENHPAQHRKANTKGRKQDMLKGKGQPSAPAPTNPNDEAVGEDFDKLMDDLQIPPTLRPKLAGMDATVKAAMVKSSHTLAIRPRPEPPHTPPRGASLRRAHSIESISSPARPGSSDLQDIFTPPSAPYMHMNASPNRNTHSRGKSFDTSRIFSKSQVNLANASASTVDLTTAGKVNKDKAAGVAKTQSPNRFLSILLGSSSTELDIESVKKLRLMLRNESAGWTQEFLKIGGYNALMLRLNEILEVEWREEQHDDQILYELLRCFKALSTSAIGCFALRSSCPNPYVKLVALIYSDKRPGDVPSRQLIIELLLLLFDLYPPSSLPSTGRSRPPRREAWETASTTSPQPSALIILPAPHKSVFSLVRGMLLTPAPPPAECPATPVSPHEFIESIHKPRIYKTYLQELSDVCRDYFWVFCHGGNVIWVLAETDESKVEKPRAPGGMTGGVEFEAIGYFTTHLRFLNTLAKCAADLNAPKEDELSAWRFHQDLFDSGLERILLIARKASTTYYPSLHLEIARYVAHAMRAGYELPWTVSRLVGLPPAALCKNQYVAQQQSSPSKRGMPILPTPKKTDPIRMT